MRTSPYLIWLLSSCALASSWSSWLPWGSRSTISNTPTQSTVPRAPSFRSIRDLDYSNELSYNEDSAVSWKDDENDKLIAKNGPVEPVMDQEEETAVIGNDETSAGHDDETMASNMARSEETSAVLQTFSDEEGDDSLFEISSQEMDMLFKTEVSKKENTPTEVSPVPGSKGTVLGVGPPTPILKPKKKTRRNAKKNKKNKTPQQKTPETPQHQLPKQPEEPKKSPRGLDEGRPTTRRRKTMNRPQRKQVRPVVDKIAPTFSLEAQLDIIGPEVPFETDEATFTDNTIPNDVEAELTLSEEPLNTEEFFGSTQIPESMEPTLAETTVQFEEDSKITSVIEVASEEINGPADVVIDTSVVEAIHEETAVDDSTDNMQVVTGPPSVSFIFEPFTMDSTVVVNNSAQYTEFLPTEKNDEESLDGLEALIERIERARQAETTKKAHKDSFFESDSDEIFITVENIESAIPYDLKDRKEEGDERMIFQPRPLPDLTSADVLDDPFGIHIKPLLERKRECPNDMCPDKITTEDDGLANCSGCLFPSGWSPVRMRGPSAFAQWRANRQRQRAHEQQQHRGLLPGTETTIHRIEQQRRGSATDTGKDAASPSPSDDGGQGGGLIEQRPRVLATTNGSALDMLLRRFRDGGRAVHRGDNYAGSGSGLGRDLHESIQEQREQHRQGRGARVQESRLDVKENAVTNAAEDPSVLGGLRQRFSTLFNSSSSSSSEATIIKVKRSLSNFFASSSSSKEEETSGLFPGLSLLFNRSPSAATTSTTAPTPTPTRTQSEETSIFSRIFK